MNLSTQANSAFHPSGVGKWVPASAGKAKAGMVHSVSGCTRGVQVKLWDPLRTRVIPERLRGAFTTRRYTNPRLPLPLPLSNFTTSFRSSLSPMIGNNPVRYWCDVIENRLLLAAFKSASLNEVIVLALIMSSSSRWILLGKCCSVSS